MNTSTTSSISSKGLQSAMPGTAAAIGSMFADDSGAAAGACGNSFANKLGLLTDPVPSVNPGADRSRIGHTMPLRDSAPADDTAGLATAQEADQASTETLSDWIAGWLPNAKAGAAAANGKLQPKPLGNHRTINNAGAVAEPADGKLMPASAASAAPGGVLSGDPSTASTGATVKPGKQAARAGSAAVDPAAAANEPPAIDASALKNNPIPNNSPGPAKAGPWTQPVQPRTSDMMPAAAAVDRSGSEAQPIVNAVAATWIDTGAIDQDQSVVDGSKSAALLPRKLGRAQEQPETAVLNPLSLGNSAPPQPGQAKTLDPTEPGELAQAVQPAQSAGSAIHAEPAQAVDPGEVAAADESPATRQTHVDKAFTPSETSNPAIAAPINQPSNQAASLPDPARAAASTVASELESAQAASEPDTSRRPAKVSKDKSGLDPAGADLPISTAAPMAPTDTRRAVADDKLGPRGAEGRAAFSALTSPQKQSANVESPGKSSLTPATAVSAAAARAAASSARQAAEPAADKLAAAKGDKINLGGSAQAAPFSALLDHATSTLAPVQINATAAAAQTPVNANPVDVRFDTPVHAAEFRAAIGVQVSVLAEGGVQHAELHLNPAEMGPISVRISLDGNQAQVDFGVDSAVTRAVLESGLPELASALREAGLTLTGGGVSEHARGQGGDSSAQQGSADNPSQQRREANAQARNNGLVADGDEASKPAQPRHMRADTGLDLYA